MFTNRIKFFMAVPIFVIAMLCAPNIATAIPITDTFTDILGQGLYDPGNIALIDEHGGPSASWADSDSDILISTIWGFGNGDLWLSIMNTSGHTMWNTVLAFEHNDIYPNWLGIFEPDTWDGEVNTNPAYWFGHIAPGDSSVLVVDLKDGYVGPPFFTYDSQGLDSPGFFESTVSVAHGAVVPEPASLILFIAGGAVLAGRKYFKRK